MFLTERQVELLNRIIRDGVEKANASLKEMLGTRLLRVEMTNPELLSIGDLSKRQIKAENNHPMSGAFMDFSGPFCGQAMLICPEEEKKDLVSVFFEPLMHEALSPEELAEIHNESICELSNILLSACIASFARLFDGEIRIRVPKPVNGNFSELVQAGQQRRARKILFMPTTLFFGEEDRHLTFGFIFDMISVHALSICLDAYLLKHGFSRNIND